eukprot:337347_1
MANESMFKDDVMAFIGTAANIDDLRSILCKIPINELKCMVQEHVEKLNTSQIATLFYESLSITNILDIDVLQYITSFNSIEEIALINPLFHQLSKLNEEQSFKSTLSIADKLQQTVQQHHHKYERLSVQYNKLSKQIAYHSQTLTKRQQSKEQTHNKMIKMHDKTYKKLKQINDQLTKKYDNMHYLPEATILHIRGFTQDFVIKNNRENVSQHITKMMLKSGDKILFERGTYEWAAPYDVEYIEFPQTVKDLHLIGMNEGVIINVTRRSFIDIKKGQNIWFENITFKFAARQYREEYEGFIRLNDASNVWANGCTFQCPKNLLSITVEPNSSLSLRQCVFDGGRALSINPYSKRINVVNCKFIAGGESRNVNEACIEIQNDDENRQFYRQHNCLRNASLRFTCIGNTFINNMIHAIGAKCEYFGPNYTPRSYVSHWVDNFDPSDSDHYVIKDNILQGDNCSTEPNKIYIRIVDAIINY